jgi:hypothetical protein
MSAGAALFMRMSVLNDLREILARMRTEGLEVEHVQLSPEAWAVLKADYVAETGRFGPLEIIGREVLGVPTVVDEETDTITIVQGDETDDE